MACSGVNTALFDANILMDLATKRDRRRYTFALEMLASFDAVFSLDLALAECAHGLRNRVADRQSSRRQARLALRQIRKFLAVNFVEARAFTPQALTLALKRRDISTYDAHYVTAARTLGLALVTADLNLVQSVKSLKRPPALFYP